MSRRIVGNLVPAVTAALFALWAPCAAPGHETDQFSVPPENQELADIGDYLNEYFVSRIEGAVERTNRDIEKALRSQVEIKRPRVGRRFRRKRGSRRRQAADALADLRSHDHIVEQVWKSFPPSYVLIEDLQREMRNSSELKEKYPDQLLIYRAPDLDCVFTGVNLPIDPRNVVRLWRSGTVNAYGTYMGFDKVGHFTDMGHLLYLEYSRRMSRGDSVEAATQNSIKAGTRGFWGENMLFGKILVGAYSNADLAANYVGLLFFRNLVEPVELKGRMHPPILEQDGEFWKVADHVRGDPKFFSRFISDHFDEALNPSLYDKAMRSVIRRNVRERVPSLVEWYGKKSGRTLSKENFDDALKRLSTYHGSNYGHRGDYHELVSIGSCMDSEPAESSGATASKDK